jgi:hypothetical protein
MPRFFFHIYDDAVVRDEEGIELADRRAAEQAAIAGARALICDQVMKGRIALGHRIEVEDQAGAQVATISFADAVHIED